MFQRSSGTATGNSLIDCLFVDGKRLCTKWNQKELLNLHRPVNEGYSQHFSEINWLPISKQGHFRWTALSEWWYSLNREMLFTSLWKNIFSKHNLKPFQIRNGFRNRCLIQGQIISKLAGQGSIQVLLYDLQKIPDELYSAWSSPFLIGSWGFINLSRSECWANVIV